MTEEIIIDGVDVAGCEYYKGKCMEYTHYCQIGCKECTDIGIKLCHYKQTERFKAKITRLEQENKELKKANQSLSILGTDLASAHETVRKEFFRADKNKDMWREKAENYHSALEEIKAISDNYNLTVNNRRKQIADKINEVLK